MYYTTYRQLYWLAAHTNTGSRKVFTDKFCDMSHYTTISC